MEDAEESVRNFARESGFEESDEYFIALAVREVLVNAIRHGNRFDPDKKVGLRVFREDSELVIEVTDQGEGFRLESVPDPHLPENLERPTGRGIAIAKAVMDELSVEHSPSGTIVRMAKRLPSG
ncbi:MAG TPA: ATP-binding protein [Bryobacteraceae bacterium]|nr:ATP-binding protein [Bryobacteraceae bacterium]